MSTDHNRIKVADLEKNQPDKILVTNQNGELEFNNVNSFQTESYNALDYTTEGKALDARQGKVLKDMINTINVSPPSLVNDLTTGGTAKALTAEMGKTLENTKLTASLATDAETQIAASITEDNKVVSRLKLFNWWKWITKSPLKWYNTITLKQGNSTGVPLIIPPGILIATPIIGAVETDSKGIYFTTEDGIRKNLFDKAIFSNKTLALNHFGQGFTGPQEFITPLATNLQLFNNGEKQNDVYSIFSTTVISDWLSTVSSVKLELQINVSNSAFPNTWYTMSVFEANRNDLPSGLPLNVLLSANLTVNILREKYLFFSGIDSSLTKNSIIQNKTDNLSINNEYPLKQDMIVSIRVKSNLLFNTNTTYQQFFGRIILFQVDKKQ